MTYQTTTVAVTASLNERSKDENNNPIYWCDPNYAPIWTDGQNDYLVASGISEDTLEASDPITAQPDRVNIVVGMEGLAALAAMGLTVKDAETASE
jgi:hypothetical protein